MSNLPNENDRRDMIATVVERLHVRYVENVMGGMNLVFERRSDGTTFDVLSYASESNAVRAMVTGAAERRIVARVLANPDDYLR